MRKVPTFWEKRSVKDAQRLPVAIPGFSVPKGIRETSERIEG